MQFYLLTMQAIPRDPALWLSDNDSHLPVGFICILSFAARPGVLTRLSSVSSGGSWAHLALGIGGTRRLEL